MTRPYWSEKYDKEMAIKREEKKWERILEKIDRRDKEKINGWRGQSDADCQYSGSNEEYYD